MKKTLLIPLPILTLSAAIVPSITSCSNGWISFTQNIINGHSDKNYQPKVKQATGTVKEADLEQFYFNAIAKDKRILADDLYWNKFNDSNANASSSVKFVKRSNIKIRSIDAKTHILSFDYKEWLSTEEKANGKVVYTDYEDVYYKVNNAPFELNDNTWPGYYEFALAESKLGKDSKWSIEIIGKWHEEYCDANNHKDIVDLGFSNYYDYKVGCPSDWKIRIAEPHYLRELSILSDK